MKNSSSNGKEESEEENDAFNEDGLATVVSNSSYFGTNNLTFSKSNFEKLIEENAKLRDSVKELTCTLGNENSYLKNSLDKLQKEHAENTELLKLQANYHKEDWEVERNEKNAAQSEISYLQSQVRHLVAKLAEKEAQIKMRCRCSSSPDHPMELSKSDKHLKKHRTISNGKMSSDTASSSTESSPSLDKNYLGGTSPAVSRLERSPEPNSQQSNPDNLKEQTHISSKYSSSKGERTSSVHKSISKSKSCEGKKEEMFKGAKPKSTSKSCHKEKRDSRAAKNRARNILASALPISPSSSTPSSPINSPGEKEESNEMNYLPITSTVLTPVNYRASKSPQKCLTDKQDKCSCQDIPDCCHKLSKFEFDEDQHETTNIVCHKNDNGSKVRNFQIPKDSSDSGVSCCTSITVLSGSHGHSQATSTNSSRSSSPGISLMTFALNAEGQGIPGAFYFALGPEANMVQRSRSEISLKHPITHYQALTGKNITLQPNSPYDVHEDGFKERSCDRVVNATWVKLSDKDEKSRPLLSWRTARAVPSHQLMSNKKSSCDSHSKDNIEADKEKECKACYCVCKEVNDSKPTIKIQDSSELNSNKQSDEINHQDKIDLKSLASRNISTAILSYENSTKIPSRNLRKNSIKSSKSSPSISDSSPK